VSLIWEESISRDDSLEAVMNLRLLANSDPARVGSSNSNLEQNEVIRIYAANW
jgi:hypothetical protein